MLAVGRAYLATVRYKVSKKDYQAATPMFTKARDTFRQGIEKWPDELGFYMYYAETAARSGNLGDAEEMLRKVAVRDVWKDRIEPQLLLAEFYSIAGKLNESEAVLRAVVAKVPDNIDAQLRLATILAANKKADEAIQALAKNATDPRIARRRVELLMSADRKEDCAKSDGRGAGQDAGLDRHVDACRVSGC